MDNNELGTNLAEVGTDVPDINVGELISRQRAIDAFNTNIDELVVAGKENADAVERYLNRVIDEIKQLPPIQPKRGKWIDKGWTGDWQYLTDGRGNCWKNIVCSECGESVRHESKFCPNCGAKMEVNNESN